MFIFIFLWLTKWLMRDRWDLLPGLTRKHDGGSRWNARGLTITEPSCVGIEIQEKGCKTDHPWGE